MRIMIFTEGTLLMHKSGKDVSREGRVKQVIDKDKSVKNYAEYVPVGRGAEKTKKWNDDGAQIIYLTSRKTTEEIEQIRNVLDRYGFPHGKLEYRHIGEEYKDVAEKIIPDILIEDDCESIGGEKEMTYTYIESKKKAHIKSIPVEEFGGIDHLPDALNDLLVHQEQKF